MNKFTALIAGVALAASAGVSFAGGFDIEDEREPEKTIIAPTSSSFSLGGGGGAAAALVGGALFFALALNSGSHGDSDD